jgi:hypothetical protein
MPKKKSKKAKTSKHHHVIGTIPKGEPIHVATIKPEHDFDVEAQPVKIAEEPHLVLAVRKSTWQRFLDWFENVE